jgi:hypothetical protein
MGRKKSQETFSQSEKRKCLFEEAGSGGRRLVNGEGL